MQFPQRPRIFPLLAFVTITSCSSDRSAQDSCHAEHDRVSFDYACSLTKPTTPLNDEVIIAFHHGNSETHDVRQLVIERFQTTASPTDWAATTLGSLIADAAPETMSVSGYAAVRYVVNGEGVYQGSITHHHILRVNDFLYYILLTAEHPTEAIRQQYLSELEAMLTSLTLS